MPELLRVPVAEDAQAIAALYTGHRSIDAREVRSWLANPGFDPENDFRLLERDGKVVGYADVHAQGDRLAVDLMSADPAAGQALLDWAEERARAQGIDRVAAWAWPGSDVVQRVVESRGFTPFRTSLEMQAPLDADMPDPTWPVRVQVRTAEDADEQAIHALGEEAFAGGNDFSPTPYEEWAAFWEGRKRHDLWFVAEGDGVLAGIALCEAERAGAPGLGWIETLAVRRAWRRQGLGRALVLRSFRELRRRGCATVGLSVAAENPTGAVRLYESVGMRPVSERVLYEKRLSRPSAL